MREITKTLYYFSELSEEAQEKVMLDCSGQDNYFLQDENNDTLKAFEAIFPVTVKDWEYGYNGNYINYKHHIEDDILKLRGVRLLRYIINNYYDDLFKPAYLRQYKGKARYSKIKKDNSCVLTGYCIDDDILQPLYDFLKKPDPHKDLNDLMSECLHSWLCGCSRDFEYANSEKGIREDLENRDDEFDEHGNRE